MQEEPRIGPEALHELLLLGRSARPERLWGMRPLMSGGPCAFFTCFDSVL